MKKVTVFFLAALCCATLRAQDSKSPLFGKVLDSLGSEVPYASLQLMANNKKVMADEKGRFDFGSISFPDTLEIISDYYQHEKIYLAKSVASNDTLLVRLKFFFKQLDPIEVTAKYNLDSILHNAFEKFNKSYVTTCESEVFLRAVQQHGRNYTGIMEAVGNCYFYVDPSDYFLNFYAFSNARSTSFEEQRLFAIIDLHEVTNIMQFSLPRHTEWFNKTKVKTTNQSSSFISITLIPKPEHAEDLKKLDEKYNFSINTPSIFSGIQRTYIIDLTDNRLVSVELRSTAVAKAELDNNKRNYIMRKFYYRFKYINNAAYLDFTIRDAFLTAPRGKSGVWHFTYELYFKDQKKKELGDSELLAKYNVAPDKELTNRAGFPFLLQRRSNDLPNNLYCYLPFKNFNGTFNRTDWEKKYIPTFPDRKKLFEDLKDNPLIGDFISKNEK